MIDPTAAEQERCGVGISASSGVAQVIVSCKLPLGHDGKHEGQYPTTPAEQKQTRTIMDEINVCAGNSDFADGVYDDEVAGLIATALAERRERAVRAIIAADIGGFCGCRQDGEATCPTHRAMVAAIRRDDA